jgi:hypothetical protein
MSVDTDTADPLRDTLRCAAEKDVENNGGGYGGNATCTLILGTFPAASFAVAASCSVVTAAATWTPPGVVTLATISPVVVGYRDPFAKFSIVSVTVKPPLG